MINDFTLSSSGDGSLNISESKDFNVFLSQNSTDNSISYQVKYTIGSGSVGNGIILKGGVAVPFGTFQSISTGTSQLTFNGTGAGKVNINVEVKDSNGIIHSSVLAFDVKAISYSFSGASQDNTIFINGSTPITFDITETAPSGTNYEIKYALTQGNALVKNGANTMTANQWESVNVGSFNRTFVGTTVGTIKVLFTVRNKTTLVEKTQEISIAVNPSVFSFNAVRANNDQVVNTQTNINFNLTQTGGTSDTYNMTFTTSSTGTFTYNGVEYTAGQIIPITIGASTGSYKGTKSGKHDVEFTATNQINISKSSAVQLNYINNDFTLSTTGDGSLFVNQTKDLSVFLSQLIPDNSISYQVKYSFDSGTIGNGTLTNAGNPISLGSYQTIDLNSTPIVFKATSFGKVNLLVEVKNSNGLLKSSIIMLDVKNADFIFTGGAVNPNGFVNDDTGLSFDLSEASPSGTDYEMSFNITSGNASIKDAGSTLNAFQWYDVTTGAFQRELTALTQGDITIVFTVRNKTTLQSKSVTITINAYQKPTPTNIYTSLDFFNRGNGHEDQWRWYIYMEFKKNPNATITSVILTVAGDTFILTPSSVIVSPNGQEFRFAKDNSGNPRGYYDFKSYSIKVTDSNGIVTTTTGTWRNNEF